MSETNTGSQDDADEQHANWQARADELHAHGIPERRAAVVAMVEAGLTYREIAAELGFGSDNDDESQVATHVKLYRTEDLPNARWLAENGPEI